MSVTIDLPADVLARLEAEAARRGVDIDVVVAQLVEALPAERPSESAGRRPAFVAIGSSNGGITDRIEGLLAEGFGRD